MVFKKGDEVFVRKPGLYTTGKTGVVEGVCGSLVSVYIVGYGSLNYNPGSLKLNKNKGEGNMLMGKYTVCKIRFIEGSNTSKDYDCALFDNNLGVGDHVVVKSANHGFGLAKITEIVSDDCVTQAMLDYCNAGREVVSGFDMSAYEERLEKRKIAKQLKADMNKKMKEMQELAMFEMMAEKNPELKDMLDKYKELVL